MSLTPRDLNGNLAGRPGKPISFVDFVWSRYWPVISSTLAMTSQTRERSILTNLVAEWGARPITLIKREDIDGWRATLSARVGPWTVLKYTSRCKHVFRQAEEWGYIPKNPAVHVRKGRVPEGRVRWLTDDERALIMLKASPALRAYIIISRETGERRGAVCGLQRHMIDLDEGMVTYPAGLTKTGRTHRAPITKRLRGVLDELGVEGMAPDDYVLPRVCPSSVSRAFRKLCRRLGIKDFRFHDLLHDGCSSLARAGRSLKEIMDYRNHKRAQSSLIYQHLSPSHLRGVLDEVL